MASSRFASLLFFLSLLYHPLSTHANLHKAKLFRASEIFSQDSNQKDTPITTYFQVTKPIKLPKTKPCSSLVLQHDFGFTYNRPPVLADYKPPSNCPSQNFSKIVLEWKATCKGRQFDRIFGVWLGGVELLRSCTAEPRATGIVWTVEKEITRYSSLLKNPQTLAVYLGNLVDSTYTGIYHVNLTFHFYPVEQTPPPNQPSSVLSPADLILPISRNLPLNDGLWFLVQNSTEIQSKQFKIPQNSYRAVLEVYVSFHSSDEFWFGNPPNEYLIANNLTDSPGNGPFREVVVSLDGNEIGAVWPFTVVYTGGINPLLWRPITGIGSFDLPSYDIEITPFLGKILDGKQHEFGFGVTNALDVWFIDANLHVWLDHKSKETMGELIKYEHPSPTISLVSNFKGLNGSFLTSATRSISSSGWVKSSYGKITTHSFQEFSFTNLMEFGKNGNSQIVNQTIDANKRVYAMLPSSYSYSDERYQNFPFYLHTDNVDQGNGSYASVANVSLGFNEKGFAGSSWSGFDTSILKNLQNGQGSMLVKGNLVTSGLGSTQQVYSYERSRLDGDCYFWNVSSTNYTILYDIAENPCSTSQRYSPGFGLEKWKPL
ncbi:Peptide-N4-(N-acetyl-beta-glucosaminyl)asparagine amidase A [Macleaya cordata]|uniref:Peptide-N4-(N-acetyl-beta-glucosaminyl)asparagine amidase A n=1 Tax=Macleaya cordata TaxID=56857 RepID=A0A200QT16_MACCD|nr:Peptide-N4-(N-acetyl-beta-glucosaminyl)asparagine amidase A [Macleaya cordata]